VTMTFNATEADASSPLTWYVRGGIDGRPVQQVATGQGTTGSYTFDLADPINPSHWDGFLDFSITFSDGHHATPTEARVHIDVVPALQGGSVPGGSPVASLTGGGSGGVLAVATDEAPGGQDQARTDGSNPSG